MSLHFYYSEERFKLFDEEKISVWIKDSIRDQNKQLGEIHYHFVSEEEILDINTTYLNHNYFTDIITFDECFVNIINGELFISPDTISTNSQIFKSEERQELFRVIIHGIMHLCGFNDQSDDEKVKMRRLEDYYLERL